jgi:imidazolonepropionase-like amidohydrolase
MRKRSRWLVLAAATVFAIAAATVAIVPQFFASAVQVEQSDTITAFVGVTVVPMDSPRVLPNQTVIVRGEHIAEIGPANKVQVPATARRIDAQGLSLMPGLADMHVHLMEGQSYLPLFLANGVTTVRNMAGGPGITSFRDRIQKRTLLGPNIYTAGPPVDGSPPVWEGSDVVVAGEEAWRLVEAQKNAGYDFLKVYDNLQPAAYEAIMRAAGQLHMPVAGHVPPHVGLQRVLDAHQHSIEHLTGYFEWLQTNQSPFQHENDNEVYRHPAHLLPQRQSLVDGLDESRIPKIASATAKAGTWNVPTLVAWRNMKRREDIDSAWKSPDMQYVTPMLRNWWNSASEYTPENFAAKQRGDAVRNKLLKALHDAGARILVGTDAPHPFVLPGFSVHEELANFVAAGLSPYEALRAATADAAEFLGAAGQFGTVKPGARADLILVMGNPLKDVGNAHRIVGVMVRGLWLSRDDLRRGLNAVPQASSKGVNQ